jgi:MFS family permease
MLDIVRVFRERPFRRFLVGLMILNLPFTFAIPYYQVFHLTVLHMNKFSIGCIVVAYGITKILTAKLWGKAVDRVGPRRIMFMVSPVYTILFTAYVFSEPGHVWPIFLGWTVCGAADGGWGVASMATLYGAVPSRGARPAFFAVFNLAIFGLYGIGALVAVHVLKWLEHAQLALGPLTLDRYHIFFAIPLLLMLPCVSGGRLFPRRVRSTEETGAVR